jgi:hypothetical protein
MNEMTAAHGFPEKLSDESPGIIAFPLTPEWEMRRLRAIEGEFEIVDPWRRTSDDPFHLTAKQLLARAQAAPPAVPGTAVTDFTAWIYSLYVKDEDPRRMREGKEIEAAVFDFRRVLLRSRRFHSLGDPKWMLLHRGLGIDVQHRDHMVFDVPRLTVSGRPLRACPDLVFRHEETGEILLIEVKFSSRVIPSNLWPNVWAQLWAYSLVEEFVRAPRITAVGEVWGDNSGSWHRFGLTSPICLRRAMVRDPRAVAFTRFFRTMFETYGGQVQE